MKKYTIQAVFSAKTEAILDNKMVHLTWTDVYPLEIQDHIGVIMSAEGFISLAIYPTSEIKTT